MSNDVPDAGGAPERGSRRGPRLGDSGAPIGSTLAIVLALVAVVAGFLILRAISDDGDGGAAIPDENGAVDSTPGLTTTTTIGGPSSSVTTTQPAGPQRTGARVVVANANNTGGSAGRFTRQLDTAGYTMGDPVDAAGAENELQESKVYFVARNARAQAVANTLAEEMGGIAVAPMPAEIPVEGGSIGRAGVLLMLGIDSADANFVDLAPEEATGQTNPDVAGGADTTEG